MLHELRGPRIQFRKIVALISLLMILAIGSWPILTSAQTCNSPTVVSATCQTVLLMTVVCFKAVHPIQGCMTTVNFGAKGTFGSYLSAPITPSLGYLVCYRPTAATGTGYCSVTGCTCGTLKIDNSDGLPVELMEFGVD